jgi:hypothetical protein
MSLTLHTLKRRSWNQIEFNSHCNTVNMKHANVHKIIPQLPGPEHESLPCFLVTCCEAGADCVHVEREWSGRGGDSCCRMNYPSSDSLLSYNADACDSFLRFGPSSSS